MGRMRREFEGYRRLRTFSAAPKTALHRLFMGGDGGQRARHKIAVPTSRTACESRHHIARRKDVFYVGMVRNPTPPAPGPTLKAPCGAPLFGSSRFEPSVHQDLKVCPPATASMISSLSHSLWLFFPWFHILHLTVVCHDSTNIICRPSPRPNCTHVFRSCVYVACRDACRSRITSTRRSRITASTSTSTRSSFLPCCAPNVHSTLASATSSSRWARQVWRCARAC